jgi:DNA topoisomerase 2-associated protein PAT1
MNDSDDGHVWQFLAAIAVGANIDQQHILVTEVR